MLAEKPDDRRNSLKVVVVGENDQQRVEIRSALAELGDLELDVAEAGPQSATTLNGGTEVAMVVVENSEDASLEFIQTQAQASPRPALFALLAERSSNLMRRALRAGADEVLFLPMDHGDVTRALLKISEARRRVERPGRGQICALVSVTGGVGVTTLATGLGLGLRYHCQKQVAAVDLDFQSSDLSVMLNVEPEHTIVDIADSSKKLDSVRLESALTKHSSGLYLLAAPKRIEDGEAVSADQVGAALDLMRQLFDFVVVDCGRNLNEITVAVWERSDHLYYVINQSIASVRCAWRFLDLFGRLGISGVEPGFLLNCYSSHLPVSEEQIYHTLARPIYARMPRDDKALEQAQTKAQDLWKVAPNSPLSKGLEELVRKLGGTSEKSAQRGGRLFSWLFSNATAQSQG